MLPAVKKVAHYKPALKFTTSELTFVKTISEELSIVKTDNNRSRFVLEEPIYQGVIDKIQKKFGFKPTPICVKQVDDLSMYWITQIVIDRGYLDSKNVKYDTVISYGTDDLGKAYFTTVHAEVPQRRQVIDNTKAVTTPGDFSLRVS